MASTATPKVLSTYRHFVSTNDVRETIGGEETVDRLLAEGPGSATLSVGQKSAAL